MAAGDIYRKTDKGQAEIQERKLKLLPRLRTMLILIDGTQPEFLLKEAGARMGAPDDFLQQLAALGLIERAASGTAPAPAAPTDEFMRFRSAKHFMNTTIVDALGFKSFLFTMKLERAGVCADLAALLDEYEKAIAKSQGAAQAEVLAARLREMLG
jgi:hypothetical protein